MARAMAPRDPLTAELFAAWRDGAGKPGARLDGQREALFARLAAEGVTVAEVRDAVAGAKLDHWAVQQAKLAASAILGSAEQREKYAELLRNPPAPANSPRPGQPGYERWGPGRGNGLQPNDPTNRYVPPTI